MSRQGWLVLAVVVTVIVALVLFWVEWQRLTGR
jgi:hypothetical protein